MRVHVEVVGRPLDLRGPRYAVGERLFLDTDNPRHREALDRQWVRPLAVPIDPPPAGTAALDAPPVHRMMEPGAARIKTGARKDRRRA